MKQYIPFSLILVFLLSTSLLMYQLPGVEGLVGSHPKWAYDFQFKTDSIKYSPTQLNTWQNEVPLQKVWWMRSRIKLDKLPEAFQPQGMFIAFNASYDLYWNGHLIGKNGSWAENQEKETAGAIHQRILVPDSLLKLGVNDLTFRVSHHFRQASPELYLAMALGDFQAINRSQLIVIGFIFVLAGLYLTVGVYFILMYFGSFQDISHLLLGSWALSLLSLIILEYSKYYYDYPYHYHGPRLSLILVNHMIISYLTPIFLLFYLKISPKPIILFLLILIHLAIFFVTGFRYDELSFRLSAFSFLFTFLVYVYGGYQQRKWSIKIFLGLASLLLIWYNYDEALFLGAGLFLGFILFNHIEEVQKRQKSWYQSKIKSARLEAELLRKSLQPHFLMNSLFAIIATIEEDPAIAIIMTEHLGQELNLLNELSRNKLIPIGKEIQLCEYHLKVMQYRKEVNYHFHTEGIDESEKVPPAIFHTLLENGITHHPGANRGLHFYLSFQKSKKEKTYYLKVSDLPKHKIEIYPKDGTGLSYIKNRLEENYPGKWQLKQGPQGQFWQTTITLLNE